MKTAKNPLKVDTTQAKKIKEIIKKKKKLLREYHSTVEFKEPCAILIRRSGKAEWMEDCTKGKLEIKHSDGGERYIYLKGETITLEYADKGIRTYILHEDHPIPITTLNPVVTSETLTQIIQKTMHDLQELQAKKWGALGEMIWKIGAAIALCIAAYALYKLLVPNSPEPIETAVNITQAITNQTLNGTTITII